MEDCEKKAPSTKAKIKILPICFILLGRWKRTYAAFPLHKVRGGWGGSRTSDDTMPCLIHPNPNHTSYHCAAPPRILRTEGRLPSSVSIQTPAP